ncbi:MAG: DUF2851 family protein [Paludibacteraceae bacterium]|nr:DUF2851 family protein [Paludibacteraceae bacterium]
MPEILLHYIWEHCLWAGWPQKTTDGQSIEILSVGEHNRDSGPDYSHARIRIGQQEWVGNIEIHVNSSDWYKHKHHLDSAYDSVILHVVSQADKQVFNSCGQSIMQCELQYPHEQDYLTRILTDAQQIDSAQERIRCAKQLLHDPHILSDGWRKALLYKRLECKHSSIQRLLEITKGSWEHAFYISLARNFGFHTNSQPFEQLALSTPLSCLQKHRNNLFQLTAILLGQASLIAADEHLAKEYAFLRTKFSLTPINGNQWKHARMRPQNSPEIRVRQFAALLWQSEFLFSRIQSTDDLDSLAELFTLKTDQCAPLGRSSIDILLINTIIPYRYAYALQHNNKVKADEAADMMKNIAPENNTIIRQWRMLGQQVRSAADTQALLHLYQHYCQPHSCVNCEVGYQVFIDKQLRLF